MILLVWLTAVWVGLWGSLTPANLLGGLLVAGVLLRALPLQRSASPGRVRPLAVLRFLGVFLVALVQSSLEVAALVLRRRTQLHPAVIAVPVRGGGDRLLTLVANAISLTPGTLTLEVDPARAVLYVHVLDVGAGPDGLARARRGAERLERAAAHALGVGR